jgi:hypothetical protein
MATTSYERRDSQAFDIWHEIPLVPQVTGMSCWAAAAAMVVGWRDCVDIDPAELARASGRWEEYRIGLEATDADVLARSWGLIIESVPEITPGTLRRLLERHGPLWVGEASPGLHVVVIAGAFGDGTMDGTRVRIADPWPVGKGERYTLTVRELAHSLKMAATLSGASGALMLHAGGRGRGSFVSSSSSMSVEREVRTYGGMRYGTPVGLLRKYVPAGAAGSEEAEENPNPWCPALYLPLPVE